jgi:hypothetical protein
MDDLKKHQYRNKCLITIHSVHKRLEQPIRINIKLAASC